MKSGCHCSFFFSSRRRHTRSTRDWSSDVCSSDLAREAVYARLRDWILRGPLEPGEIIRDADIAQALGVSRTPVREALLRLEGDGLVETAPARWTRVAPL